MKRIIILILYLYCTVYIPIWSARMVVTSASGVNKTWKAGDTIVMQNGIWRNQVLSFKGNGSAKQPIVLMAQEGGRVVMTGSSKVSFSGSYIEVKGLKFEGVYTGNDAVVSFRTSSSEVAVNCRMTDCAIVGYNVADSSIDTKWVSLYGKNNQVDHCFFENKTNSGTLLVVWLKEAAGAVGHRICNNFFGYRKANVDAQGKELNGQEIMRIGDSSTSMEYARCWVADNYFERCDGEIEIISNKSCGNIYTNNTFYECSGMLTLRHGNDCMVQGNYFFGNGKKDSGGVRIIGQGHLVYNNYMQELTGRDYRAAICIVRGKPNSALNEYYQVKNAQVMFNTIVNCAVGLVVNYNSDPAICTLPPIGTRVEHNHIYNSEGSNTNVYLYNKGDATLDVTYKNNLMNQGKYYNFSYAAHQIIIGKDAKMALNNEQIRFWEPTLNSALLQYKTADLPTLTTDLRGRIRGEERLVGASEIEGDPTVAMATALNTSPRWMVADTATAVLHNESPNGARIAVTSDRCRLYFNNSQGVYHISVYDTNGVCLLTQNANGEVVDLPIARHNRGLILQIRSQGVVQSLKFRY